MKPKELFLSFIVPVFNEENRLETAFPSLVEYLGTNFIKWEVLYVDDGSTDSTYQKLLRLQATYPSLRVLHYEKNRGKGYAVRKGLEAAHGEVLVFSDADFSTPIEETTNLLDCLLSGCDVVIGSRGLANSHVEIHQPWLREAMGKAGNLVVRTLLPLDLMDTQCGFKMFRREAVEAILPGLRIDGFAFDIEMLTIAQLRGMRVAEIPVTWRNVLESKVRFSHSLQVLRDVFTVRFRMAMGEYS